MQQKYMVRAGKRAFLDPSVLANVSTQMPVWHKVTVQCHLEVQSKSGEQRWQERKAGP